MHTYNRRELIEWCRGQLLSRLKDLTARGAPCYEDEFYGRLCWSTPTVRSAPGGWVVLSNGKRAILISEAIDGLLNDRLIETVPGKTQATGRRVFREKNPLDAIVDAVDEAYEAEVW